MERDNLNYTSLKEIKARAIESERNARTLELMNKFDKPEFDRLEERALAGLKGIMIV